MADKTVTLTETIAEWGPRRYVFPNRGLDRAQEFQKVLTNTLGSVTDSDHSPPFPRAPKIEWPPGTTLFETNWRLLSEALTGSGVLSRTAFELSSGSSPMEVDINAGTLYYEGSDYSLNNDTTLTLDGGHASYDRYDTIYYDVTHEEVRVRKGIAEPVPEVPDIKDEEVFLGFAEIASNDTDIGDGEIHNWRGPNQDASEVRIEDSGNNYSANNVEDALSEIVNGFIASSGGALNGPLDLSNFSGSAPLDLGTNLEVFGQVVDATIDGNASQGDQQSFSLGLDGQNILQIYTEADGNGGLQNIRIEAKEESSFREVVNFHFNEAKQFLLEKFTGEPSPGHEGRILYDEVESELKIDDGNSVKLPKGRIDPDVLRADESGAVTSGDAGIMYMRGLDQGETLEILHASLMLADGQPAPNGLNLSIVTFDNSGTISKQQDIITGDGSVQDDVSGDPITAYSTSSTQTVGIVVDNGKLGSGTGSDQDIQANLVGNIDQTDTLTLESTIGSSDSRSENKS